MRLSLLLMSAPSEPAEAAAAAGTAPAVCISKMCRIAVSTVPDAVWILMGCRGNASSSSILTDCSMKCQVTVDDAVQDVL